MNRKSDIIYFDPAKEEEVPEEQVEEVKTKAQVSDETKTGKTEKEKKIPRYMKPKVATNLPNMKENNLTKARMLSFQQLYEFNNLFLNKSFLRKRTRAAEEDIFKL